jgi:hypothetical protein
LNRATPIIDAIGKRGVRFTQFYSTSPTSSKRRGTLRAMPSPIRPLKDPPYSKAFMIQSPFLFIARAASTALLLAAVACAADFPEAEWPAARPAEVGLSRAQLLQARDYALTGGGSG